MQHIIEFFTTEGRELFKKVLSRKFIAFAIATHMVYGGYLEGSEWIMLAMLYMGVEGGLDYVNRNGKRIPTKHSRDQQPSGDLPVVPVELD